VLGTRQTGLAQLRVADLVRDADLMPFVQELAARLAGQPGVAAELMQRWIGSGSRYGEV
jgi:ATP-dependent DNA helicase RecG